ncbi:hypothetical protein [Aeromonas hydrophila]|uniref:hypothetical protein n=1 Tax=Aeromonas hydrophila TaxID=644 RepID=UPI001119E861|nr:hypothetical protein [Aeromonas hydrophila]
MGNKEPTLSQSHSGTGHNIAGDMNVYNFGKHDFSTDLAIAILVGSWDESKNDDISLIEYVANKTYAEWIINIRQIESTTNSPLQHNSGKWVAVNRLATWHEVASRLFKEHLDRFKEKTVILLGTWHPKFALKPEDRYAAAIYGKVQSHSSLIRKGLSEGLALISTEKDALTNCPDNYGEFIAGRVVKEIFNSGSWILWASTQDIQPTIAEASPDEFLDAVEAAVIHVDRPFNTLFSQESADGITGNNYMTGLLWSLEKLAWSPIYLIRCIVLLGEMDSHDPGGNWANRPINSIIDILLPWLPHTTANFEKRLASVKALEREFPGTAWKVLLQLLPTRHGTTFGTSKPEWRKFIPGDFNNEVTTCDYIKQTIEYGKYIIELSRKDVSRLSVLVEHLDQLHDEAFNESIAILNYYSESDADPTEKYTLWITLLKFVNKHKKFSDANWSLPTNKINQLIPILSRLQPEDKELLYRRLFNKNTMDFYEGKRSWQEQEKEIDDARNKAVTELFTEGGYDLVLKFSGTVESATLVGNSLAAIVDHENEDLLLELLKKDDPSLRQFTSGYIWSRNYLTKGTFVESLNIDKWQVNDAAKFLLLLPFSANTWRLVETVLGKGYKNLYWNNVYVNAYQCDDEENLYRCIENLLEHGRPAASIHCLYRILHIKKTLQLPPTIRSLLAAVNTVEDSSNINHHEVGELIKYVQNCDQVADDDRFRIEWAYLPLISNKVMDDGSPNYLEGRLARDPYFFCEIIGLAYKSDKVDEPVELNEAQQNIANNAYELLNGWKVIPGTLENGSFDANFFDHWFETVSKSSRDTGHSIPILRIIGKVLIHTPQSEDGLWIEHKIAEFLNQRELDDVRNAYKLAVYNSRGAHWVDPEAKPEIKLSQEYHHKSEAIDLLGLQRFARTLREIAEGYASEAEAIIKKHSAFSIIPRYET